MAGQDLSQHLCEQVSQACADGTALVIQGGGSKAFYGRPVHGQAITTTGHTGIISYEPSELVVQARSGTPLNEVEQLLNDNRQMLAFEPPRFGTAGTLGGAVATGLSGPRRPFTGSARDFVLGTRLINGKGELLTFGGQVMKNVAGYDISRLMAGALGTLGLLCEVSLKVLPKPEVEYTLKQVCSQAEAIERFSDWMSRPLPLSAACWYDDHLYLRLSGGETAVRHAQHRLGDNLLEQQPEFWASLRDQTHAFFARNSSLWRLSVPPATPPLSLAGDVLVDWGGAQRWLYSDEEAAHIRSVAAEVGGHATLFRATGAPDDIFHPLPGPLLELHSRLKSALDPAGLFNRGRLYKDF